MIKKILLKLILIALVVLPAVTSAKDIGGGTVGPSSNNNAPTTGLIKCRGVDCDTWKELIDSIDALIQFMFKLAIVAATISIAWAGWLYLTANGDTGQIGKAHGIFWMIIKGFFIMLLAYLLVKLILTTLVVGEGFNLLQ